MVRSRWEGGGVEVVDECFEGEDGVREIKLAGAGRRIEFVGGGSVEGNVTDGRDGESGIVQEG